MKFFLLLSVAFMLSAPQLHASSSPLNHSRFFILSGPPVTGHPVVKKKKLSFTQRILYKIIARKTRKKMLKDEQPGDKMAKLSNLLGWLSLVSLCIFPLAAIPLGIMAITQGSRALELGTSYPRKARTGRTTGIISLVLLIVALVVVIVTLASIFP